MPTSPSDQLLLFPRDRAADLGRALLELAWLALQYRSYLTEAIYQDLLALAAHWRESLVARCHAERLAREMPVEFQRRRYALRARPPAPPTVARIG